MVSPPLRALARLYGVQLDFTDGLGVRREASPDVLVAVLSELGAAVRGADDAPAALSHRRRELRRRTVPPCVVAWDGAPVALPVVTPVGADDIEVTLISDDGERRPLSSPAAERASSPRAVAGEPDLVVSTLALPPLPMGYHEVTVRCGGVVGETTVISAPLRFPARGEPSWGVFAPIHGLRTDDPTRSGTLTALARVGEWVSSLGGGVVATLPLLAGFDGDMIEPSPYRPITRRLWNELYLDLGELPELAECAAARDLASSHDYLERAAELDAQALVDLPALTSHRRELLARLSSFAWTNPTRRAALDTFLRDRPEVLRYARFRAATSRRGPWPTWSEAARGGDLSAADLPEKDVAYHAYVQWQLHQQLCAAADSARNGGRGLYLDLPVGVHPDGFDTWSDRDQFCLDLEAGAPPDALNSAGQNWAIPVLNPLRSRASGHHHLRDCVRAHLRYAGVLRVDHVMGLCRLFCVPRGASAAEGVYVRYPMDELMATLSVEAHRAGAVVVGEDLGTVPDAVRRALARHGASGMFVGMFSFGGSHGSTMFPPPPGSVASFDTHDTATFAGFCRGVDIDVRSELGLATGEEERAEHAGRADLIRHLTHHVGGGDPSADATLMRIHDTLIAEMSASQAWLVLVTLEDLWLETRHQNVPGTGPERPNWIRKLGRTVAEVTGDRALAERLVAIATRPPRA